MKKQKQKGLLLGSTLARMGAFFLLILGLAIAGMGLCGTVYMQNGEAYLRDENFFAREMMKERLVYTDLRQIVQYYHEDSIGNLERYCEGKNIWVSVKAYDDDTKEMLSSWTSPDYKEESPFQYYWEATRQANESADTKLKKYILYEVEMSVNPDLPLQDEYATICRWARSLYHVRYLFPVMIAAGVLLMIGSFLFLMCSAGHKNGREGITPSVLNEVSLDILTVIFGLGAAILLYVLFWTISAGGGIVPVILSCILVAVETVWCTIYCMETAVRLKIGGFWHNTLIYRMFRFVQHILQIMWKGLVTVIKNLPDMMDVWIVLLGISVLEFVLLIITHSTGMLLGICLFEKVLLFLAAAYFTLVCRRLQRGSQALAEGDLNYQIDTSQMILGFKKHGENLNRIGEGIAAAVDQRMKSEQLKTELITNVSHDIKTPLTSIINYADLIGHEVMAESADTGAGQAECREYRLAEYAEVLLRQSKRLKKLLDDLLEASKATTGNLEVHMENCQLGVLLSQAVGEYVQRFGEKQLELIVRQPEEPVQLLADGRHLWRVFDNLLNNICKYAQEGSRVYLSVEPKGDQVEILFRNMSKYPLELSAEELEERFVRGDRSRHMEGNGLGLSIAKSLVELQKGTMEVVTDGDLFKVVLRFRIEGN